MQIDDRPDRERDRDRDRDIREKQRDRERDLDRDRRDITGGKKSLVTTKGGGVERERE